MASPRSHGATRRRAPRYPAPRRRSPRQRLSEARAGDALVVPQRRRCGSSGHRDDAPEILAAADVFVFPSLYEGLGGSLIEAMALGLPIVASDLPAIREVVEPDRNAVLVPPGSPSELASAVEPLLGDEPRRKAMGARSRQIFEERFTLERSASRMIELFERVAAGGRRPAA